jgi:Recombination endonuclease VII
VSLVAGPRQGLSKARVEAELRRQGGLCALCLRPLGASFAVDHDHKLAAQHGHDPERGCERCFRAIVCHRCNSVLGWGWDDPDFFERCAAYISLARAGALR